LTPESEKGFTDSGTRRSIVLFVVGQFFMLLGAHPFAGVCFAVLAARFWLAGDRRKAYGAAAIVAVISGLLQASFMVLLFYGAAGLLGCAAGHLMERRWPYGWRLAALAGLASACAAVVMPLAWRDLRHGTTVFVNARIAELQEQASANDQWIELFRWYDLKFPYIGVGVMVASIVLLSAYMLCVLDRWQVQQDPSLRRRTTGFQRMRLPDWLVWVAIAVALMWFADSRWPNDALRAVAWNSAIALACVYWLNGFAVLLYGLAILKVSALASLLVVSGMFLFGLMHLLGLMGLFDTWFDFRLRLRRLAMLRRVGYQPGDRDM